MSLRNNRWQLIILGLLLGEIGCVASGGQDLLRSPSDAPTVLHQFQNVGMLMKPGLEDEGLVIQCTGTLIDPWTVLTAAHCFGNQGRLTSQINKWKVYFPKAGLFSIRADDDAARRLRSYETVDRCKPITSDVSVFVCIYPTYESPQEKGWKDWHGDLALILLDRPVNSIKPAQLLANKSRLSEQSYSIAGFGMSGERIYDAGILRRHLVGRLSTCPGHQDNLPTPVAYKKRQNVHPDRNICFEYYRSVAIGVDSFFESSICNHNSGGPLFTSDKALTGVLSGSFWHLGHCRVSNVGRVPYTVFTDIGYGEYRNWITQLLSDNRKVFPAAKLNLKSHYVMGAGTEYWQRSILTIGSNRSWVATLPQRFVIKPHRPGTLVRMAVNVEQPFDVSDRNASENEIELKLLRATAAGAVSVQCKVNEAQKKVAVCEFEPESEFEYWAEVNIIWGNSLESSRFQWMITYEIV